MHVLPLENRPSFPTTLPGTLWGIAAYFNPVGYKSRLQHYKTFRQASSRQGLRLIVVEAAFGDAPFELTADDAEIVIQVRTGSVLWQKERLLSIALGHLPDDCDKVLWIDTDIQFTDPAWIRRLGAALEKFMVVQPFKKAIQLPRGRTWAPEDATGLEGSAYIWPTTMPGVFNFSGMPGYALAARRDVFDRFGLYDRMILGAGDSVMLGAYLGIDIFKNEYVNKHPEVVLRHVQAWSEPVSAYVKGSVGYLDGAIMHLWHGSLFNRYYEERIDILAQYDPSTDIRLGDGGCWEWNSDKPELHERVRAYFSARDEDGLHLPTLEERRLEILYNQCAKASKERDYYRSVVADMEASASVRIGRAINRMSYALFPRGTAFRAGAVRIARAIAGGAKRE